MPCYTTLTTKVAIGKVSLERMAEAAAADGWTVIRNEGQIILTKGAVRATLMAGSEEVRVRGSAAPAKVAAALKRSYAAKTVAEAARKHGWKLKSQTAEGETIQMKLGR